MFKTQAACHKGYIFSHFSYNEAILKSTSLKSGRPHFNFFCSHWSVLSSSVSAKVAYDKIYQNVYKQGMCTENLM